MVAEGMTVVGEPFPVGAPGRVERMIAAKSGFVREKEGCLHPFFLQYAGNEISL
jgi:hypothetical protein